MSNTQQASRTSYLANLRSKMLEVSSRGFQKTEDDRYWKTSPDKVGTASAVIRFLPPKPGAAFPFVKTFSHGYKDPITNKWFIEACPSSLGGLPSEVCPLCADNNRLYNLNSDKNCPHKKLASERKRKLSYTSNILVVSDLKNPENNGKVFLYKYGAKIFDMLKDKVAPPAEFVDMMPIDPYDMAEGANFVLRQVKKDGFPNYDRSEFQSQTAIGDAAYLDLIESQLYDLEELLNPNSYKTWDQLLDRFNKISSVSFSERSSQNLGSKPSVADGMDDDLPVARPKSAPSVPPSGVKTAAPKRAHVVVDDPLGDSDDDDYFSKLAAASSDD